MKHSMILEEREKRWAKVFNSGNKLKKEKYEKK